MYRCVGAASAAFVVCVPAVAARRRVTPRAIATGVPRGRPVGGATAGSTQSLKKTAYSCTGARCRRSTEETREIRIRLIRSVRGFAKSVATEIGTSKRARKHGRFRTSSAPLRHAAMSRNGAHDHLAVRVSTNRPVILQVRRSTHAPYLLMAAWGRRGTDSCVWHRGCVSTQRVASCWRNFAATVYFAERFAAGRRPSCGKPVIRNRDLQCEPD